MVEDLITRMFEARNGAHLAHWKTDSFSKHESLGEFYEGVIDILDRYVEANMGGFGVIGKVEGEVEDPIQMVHDDLVWLTENREKITKGVPALGNILDELTGLHMKTLYKLQNLR